MKKVLLLMLLSFIFNTTFAQESEPTFPYAKMLAMSHDELVDAKFSYSKDKNQYVLTKSAGLNKASFIMGALSGTPTNYVPGVNDYEVVIQRGENEVAYINVTFYDSEIYHKILTFATDQGRDFLETNSGSTNKIQFNYNDYSFELNFKRIGQSSASSNKGISAAKDESYVAYNFTIYTGVAPSSNWHTKQAMKEQKRDDLGKKKQSVADLM